MLKPKSLLHLEGAAVLIAACILHRQSQGGWLWFGLLFLAPDLSMLCTVSVGVYFLRSATPLRTYSWSLI
jgi:hypothetical protein